MSNISFGLNISEQEYRKLPYPSYSLLSDLEKEGPFSISKPRVDISLEDPIIVGSLVDKLLTDSKNLGKVYTIDKIPQEKARDVINTIIEECIGFPVPLDVFHADNVKHIMEICDRYEYFKQKDTRIKYLKEFKTFIDVYMAPRPENSIIITTYLRDQAYRVVNAIKKTFPSFSEKNGLGQVKLLGTVNGLELKVMFDMILVNHKQKVLYPFDLKTGVWLYEEFPKGNFVKFNYYLQGALYKEVLLQNLQGTPFEGYSVAPFRFLYCSRDSPLPMVFKMTEATHDKALNGFYSGGKWKKGLFALIEEYKFYISNPSNLYRREFIKIDALGNQLLEYDL